MDQPLRILGRLPGSTRRRHRRRRFILFVQWESEEAADSLLAGPAPHEWYERFRRCFEDGLVTFSEGADVLGRPPGPMPDPAVADRRLVVVKHRFTTPVECPGPPASGEGTVQIGIRFDDRVCIHLRCGTAPSAPRYLGLSDIHDERVELYEIARPFQHTATQHGRQP